MAQLLLCPSVSVLLCERTMMAYRGSLILGVLGSHPWRTDLCTMQTLLLTAIHGHTFCSAGG